MVECVCLRCAYTYVCMLCDLCVCLVCVCKLCIYLYIDEYVVDISFVMCEMSDYEVTTPCG